MLSDLLLLRGKTHMSLRELAKQSGVAKSTIQQIESGHAKPQIDTVCALAFALDIEPEVLFHILIHGEDFAVKADA